MSHYINYFHIIFLVEELAATATDAFGNYLPVVLPLLLSSLSVPKGMSAATMMKNEHITPPLASLEQTLHCYNSLRGLKNWRRKLFVIYFIYILSSWIFFWIFLSLHITYLFLLYFFLFFKYLFFLSIHVQFVHSYFYFTGNNIFLASNIKSTQKNNCQPDIIFHYSRICVLSKILLNNFLPLFSFLQGYYDPIFIWSSQWFVS